MKPSQALIGLQQAAALKLRADGREWPAPEEPKKDTKYGFGLKKTPKGHKHDKINELRLVK